MSDDLTKAAPAVVQQRLVLPCPACGASPAPEPASVCWWCGASLNGKMRKLKRVAEAESINAGEPTPKHFGGIGGHLRTSWDAEYSVLQVQELRECIRKCIESKVRFHYRLRYGIFAQLMQCFHQALAALRKFCGGNQIPHNAQASDVHNKRNGADSASIAVGLLDKPYQTYENRISGVHVSWPNAPAMPTASDGRPQT